jgi:hypothetical protein
MISQQAIAYTQDIVEDYFRDSCCFTSLDVSKIVKRSFPNERHGEISNVIRDFAMNEMLNHDFMISYIDVTLADGSKTKARLYHHIRDMYDLDIIYDESKRSQAAANTTTKNSIVVKDVTDHVFIAPKDIKQSKPSVFERLNSAIRGFLNF